MRLCEEVFVIAEYNYIHTRELMETVQEFCNLDMIAVSTENVDWRGNAYKSDVVTLDVEHNIGFEVLDNEIIIFYFEDHTHFEDYSSDLQDGEPDYVARAKEFLMKLFAQKIRIEKYYKKNALVKDSYYFILPESEEYIGGTHWKLFSALFCKKSLQKEVRVWEFNKLTKKFELGQV